MPRPRQRACLQDGLKLDLNHLARTGFVKFGDNIGARRIAWTIGQRQIASGVITADMADPNRAWFRIAVDQLVQQVANTGANAARTWFEKHDEEGVAFEYQVMEEAANCGALTVQAFAL